MTILSLLGCALSDLRPPSGTASATEDQILVITDTPPRVSASPTVSATVQETVPASPTSVPLATGTVARVPSPSPKPTQPPAPATRAIAVDYADVIGLSPSFYGVEYGWIDQDRDLYLDRYRRLHANVVRVQVSQQVFEPVNDNDDPNYSEIDFSLTVPVDAKLGKTMTYQDMFQSLIAEFPAMHFQINMWLAARWNATNPDGYMGLGGAFPPKDYAEHREFVRAVARWLVKDCQIPPEQLSFTFVNEANLPSFFAGDQADLVRMATETRAALDEVSQSILMGGLDEVHGTSWSDEFYAHRPAGCCDMWTFHTYERGVKAMIAAMMERAGALSHYGPVWITEFADTANGSPDAQMDFSTQEAALGFAEMLGRLWLSKVDGIVHFRLSDTYADLLGGWAGHGLFADARGTHANGQAYQPFPAYWVFANVYRELGGGQIVRVTAPSEWIVVGSRSERDSQAHLAIWVTNPTAENQVAAFSLANVPAGELAVQVFDILHSDEPIENQALQRDETAFEAHIPAKSSYLFVIRSSAAGS